MPEGTEPAGEAASSAYNDRRETWQRHFRARRSAGKGAVMGLRQDVFGIELQRDTLIVSPTRDLRELDYAQIEAGAKALLALVGSGPKNLIMDFQRTDSYGSTALAFFVKLWK